MAPSAYARCVPSEPAFPPEPEPSPEEYRQRALLLADLGRYDEAAGELAAGLAAAPGEPGLLTTLARLHLAAIQPAAALAAADGAVAAAPGTVPPLVARAMALIDERRYGEGAQVAIEILTRWPEDPAAQRTGAALLSESRNGQEALNAAWNGVRMTPREAEAHLVLAVVAARLNLFDLAQRAYAEALDLEPAIGDAQHDVGIVRLERRRWAQSLEMLADHATVGVPQAPSDGEGFEEAAPPPTFAVSRPAAPVLDRSPDLAQALRRGTLAAANGILVAALLTAIMTTVSTGVARAWAAVIAVVIVLALAGWLTAKARPEPLGAVVTRLRRTHRWVVPAAATTAISALALLLFGAIGGPVPLVTAVVLAIAAELVVHLRS